ncbi:YceI family protein [Sphingobacterium sp. SRCM116780]|uniref:YceI family protein n=1 Tax=Sphingobacterium sp. SRCM116780 TaxID=2907623 RepID=UPI001F1702E0|nr:YceI family protein [Sphingobacterium sp. SRCM116780]UIR57576.1 YceI family protein [Sphingobacterium sp. SRCM116780]
MKKSKWIIDSSHSSVQFRITYLVIASIRGCFNAFHGFAEWDENFQNAAIEFNIDANSINTNVEERDKHLRSKDFFDTELYPTISFKSTSFKKIKNEKFRLEGHLTMHGHTKLVELMVEYNGKITDQQGCEKISFEVTGKVSRWEFDMKYNSVLEANSLLIDEDIDITINLLLGKEQ